MSCLPSYQLVMHYYLLEFRGKQIKGEVVEKVMKWIWEPQTTWLESRLPCYRGIYNKNILMIFSTVISWLASYKWLLAKVKPDGVLYWKRTLIKTRGKGGCSQTVILVQRVIKSKINKLCFIKPKMLLTVILTIFCTSASYNCRTPLTVRCNLISQMLKRGKKKVYLRT